MVSFMKYDISGLDKDKIIDHYKIIKKKNNRYNVIIYYRKGVGKAINYSYKDMVDLKKELDNTMEYQMKTLVNNRGTEFNTIDKLVNKKVHLFKMASSLITIISPIILSVIFNNPINLILIPILFKINSEYVKKMPDSIKNDEKVVFDKYRFYLENEDVLRKKDKNISQNTIDSYKITELLELKREILNKKNIDSKVKVKKL